MAAVPSGTVESNHYNRITLDPYHSIVVQYSLARVLVWAVLAASVGDVSGGCVGVGVLVLVALVLVALAV